jgi:hypothetical protein
MKRSTKLFIALLVAGAVGLAVVTGAAVGTRMIYSREAAESYTFDEAPASVTLDMRQAQVETIPSDECRVEAYVKAWRTDEIEMDTVLEVRMDGDALVIVEKAFPSDFLGCFPQPYEMKVTVYAPQAALDAMGGEQS